MFSDGGELTWTQKNEEMEQVGAHITYRDVAGKELPSLARGFVQQVLDVDSAISSGLSRETVELALQMVDYQNAMNLRHWRIQNTGLDQPRVNLEDYPKVKEFNGEASQKILRGVLDKAERRVGLRIGPIRIGGISAAFAARDPHPCGNHRHPVPNAPIERVEFPDVDDPRSWFRNNGYHHTLLYARGNRGFRMDYTKGVSHDGPYGLCDRPRFRNHGRVDPEINGLNIQYEEPNPEISEYVWPYWNWGTYVLWWHNNF